jgi:putative hydrolase of the HAD superfamily
MKAVLFDVGNTLLWLDHPFVIATLREHGVSATEDELIAAQYGAKLLLDELVRTGRAGDNAHHNHVFFAELFREIGVGDELFPSIAQRLYARHAERNLWCTVRERTAETLDELRRLGYRLGVISNSDGRVEALVESAGLRGSFEFVIDSGSVGVEKPDPRIFRMALERMGIDPHDAVYVGDVYEIDVAGARAAGMRAILLDPLSRLGHLDCDRVAALHELPARLAEAA